MYQITNKSNTVFNIETNKMVKKGSVGWSLYIKWLKKGNHPLTSLGNMIIKNVNFKLSSSQLESLDNCKTISSIKDWIKETFV
jgi:hypothetical protein